MTTHGNAFAGSLAATFQAIEIEKLLAGEREQVAAGREVLLDVRNRAFVSSRLTRNMACRFLHESWSIAATPDLTLRAALALGGGEGAPRLFVPDSAFVSKLVCEPCDCEEVVWRLREAVDERACRCPRCGAVRAVRGFDLSERLSAECVPEPLLDRPLTERGLRAGEVFGVDAAGEGARYFGLGLDALPPAPGGATLVVAGLGNIGSFLAPLLGRMPGVARVILCDPDVYEAHQLTGQDIETGAVGRGKAEVQAERLRRIRPALQVDAFAAPVELLPLGWLFGAIAVSCLDSRAARLRLAARAWRIGIPFVDAAVGGGASLLVRTTVYLPDEGAACFECAFDASDYAALEQVQPCAAAA